MIKIRKNDFILIGVILLVSLTLLIIFKLNSKQGSFVTVSVDGKVTEAYSLNNDFEKLIETNNKNYTNYLIVRDGVAFISEANCPDKICVAHRGIKSEGETIVCLPHKLVIAITDSQ